MDAELVYRLRGQMIVVKIRPAIGAEIRWQSRIIIDGYGSKAQGHSRKANLVGETSSKFLEFVDGLATLIPGSRIQRHEGEGLARRGLGDVEFHHEECVAIEVPESSPGAFQEIKDYYVGELPRESLCHRTFESAARRRTRMLLGIIRRRRGCTLSWSDVARLEPQGMMRLTLVVRAPEVTLGLIKALVQIKEVVFVVHSSSC